MWVLRATACRVVFEHVGGRRVIFTCFHPEVCVALHLKQAAFPVLLLTEGNPPPANYDDRRCKTLPAALASAINEGLQASVEGVCGPGFSTWYVHGYLSPLEPCLCDPTGNRPECSFPPR